MLDQGNEEVGEGVVHRLLQTDEDGVDQKQVDARVRVIHHGVERLLQEGRLVAHALHAQTDHVLQLRLELLRPVGGYE